MTCAPPQSIIGGTFQCKFSDSNWGDTCELDCDSSSGYAGDAVISCNVDGGDETATWSSQPTCAG